MELGNWITICRKIKLDPYLITLTKINSKWIKDLDIRLETIKAIEENIGEKPFDVSLSNNLFGYDSKSTNNKSQNYKE